MSSQSNFAPRLNCESLEARENPVGNVEVFAFNGGLHVVGDAFDNSVIMVHTAERDVFLFGHNGTTVNGQSFVFLGRGTPTFVRFDMGGGSDRAEARGVVTTGSLVFTGGVGDDQLVANNCWAGWGTLEMYGQEGQDVHFISNSFFGFGVTDGANGIDGLHIDTSFAPNGFFFFNMEYFF